MTKKTLSIAYAAGPGDVVDTFAHWQKGEDDPHQIARTYSSQFFEVCTKLSVRGVVISSCPRADNIRTPGFYVENLPKKPFSGGISYHLRQVQYARQILCTVVREKADVLVISDATGHFFPFVWMAPKNLVLIPTLHCTLWPKYLPLTSSRKLINRFDANIFGSRAQAILCLSNDIREQLQTITRNHPRPIVPFMPSYRRTTFARMLPPPPDPVFNLLYAGRLESEKGIFELLDMAVRLKKEGCTRIVLHICGDGSKEQELRSRAEAQEVGALFKIHGYCRRERMLAHIQDGHAFIVPTTTSFGEGFNKVVAEAILAGRPVITSSVCPAMEYVKDAVVQVGPDDWEGYYQAVRHLAADETLYADKQRACTRLQEQFYTPKNSWGHALTRALEETHP